MNRQNAHEYLPLVQAIADGKTVQVQGGDGNWYNSKLINIPAHRYRIKPEPRTFEMWLSSGGLMYPWDAFPSSQPGMEHITVQEVLK
jgi:hypothetical protein